MRIAWKYEEIATFASLPSILVADKCLLIDGGPFAISTVSQPPITQPELDT